MEVSPLSNEFAIGTCESGVVSLSKGNKIIKKKVQKNYRK